MSDFNWVGRKIIRKDGREKANGSLAYMGDKTMGGMLYAKLKHPPVPHALIKKIEYARAQNLPGVVRIITAKDVPGINRHGLIVKDQPVICADCVRYLGDTVAVAVAETEEIAEAALHLIEVEYEQLPSVLTAAQAIQKDAVRIHPDGNIIIHYEHTQGDLEKAFREAAVICENTYTTPYQEHAYLETEGGIAAPTEDGGVEVWYPCQYGQRAKRDLAEILNLPEDKVIVYSSPLGGGFGGKDDLLLQGIMAVCAYVCHTPVKVVLSREESFLMSPKRVPFEITMKTAAAADGTFLANKVYARATAGAYASYVGAILSFAMENVCGIYYMPNVEAVGDAVYTNNCFTSAFRGFGNNQINFALESQIDLIAKKLGMDILAIRRKNSVKPGMRHCYEQILSSGAYAEATLAKLEETNLWKNRKAFKAGADKPWLRRGIGLGGAQQGIGLGNACYPDDSTCEAELKTDGKLMLYFGNEDMGQGSFTTLQMIAAETAHMPLEMVDATCGISGKTPDSGPITASRTTYVSGLAIMEAIAKLHKEVASVLGCSAESLDFSQDKVNGYTWREIAQMLSPEQRKQSGYRIFADTDVKLCFGLHYMHAHLSQIVGIEVNMLTGQTKVLETEIIPAAGTIINPLGYEGQCEGGIAMGVGYALYENFQICSDGSLATRNFQNYLLPTMMDMPKITIHPIEDEEESGPFGARGLGEIVCVPGSSAIANAIDDAVGVRIFDLPCTQEKILKEIMGKNRNDSN